MTKEIKTKRYFTCDCGKQDFDIEHLFNQPWAGQEAGPWSCLQCGRTWRIVAHNDGTADIREVGKTDRRMACLLRLDPKETGPVYIVVKNDYIGNENGQLPETADYYFHSHQCPTNYLRNIVDVVAGPESDPHGLFRLVSAKPWDRFEKETDQGRVSSRDELFEVFQTDGEPMESNW